MDGADRKIWIRAVIMAGVAYFLIGSGSAFVDPYIPERFRFTWRLFAWIASAIVFTTHIAHERLRLVHSSFATALHAAAAVACGAFLMAVGASVHALLVPTHPPLWRYLIALGAWPVITTLPAFLVALLLAIVCGMFPGKRSIITP